MKIEKQNDLQYIAEWDILSYVFHCDLYCVLCWAPTKKNFLLYYVCSRTIKIILSYLIFDESNILDLFLTSHPSIYSVKLFSPLGSSDHKLVSVTCPIAPVRPLDPPKKRRLWHYGAAKWRDLRQFFQDFPWNDYCFRGRNPSESATRLTEVILAGMEAYIPFSFSKSNANNSWFNHNCSTAIRNKEKAYKRFRRRQTDESRAIYIFARRPPRVVCLFTFTHNLYRARDLSVCQRRNLLKSFSLLRIAVEHLWLNQELFTIDWENENRMYASIPARITSGKRVALSEGSTVTTFPL